MSAVVCPFCGEPEGVVDEISPGQFAVICQDPDCGAIGPAASVQQVAVNLWNRRYAAPGAGDKP